LQSQDASSVEGRCLSKAFKAKFILTYFLSQNYLLNAGHCKNVFEFFNDALQRNSHYTLLDFNNSMEFMELEVNKLNRIFCSFTCMKEAMA